MSRWRWSLLAVAAAVVVVWTAAALTGDEPPTAEVARGPLIVGSEVTGTLRALESTVVGPPVVPGIWQFKIAMMAPEGETVAAGQPVLGFDPSQIQENLRNRMNELQRAQKEAEKSAVNHEVRTADDALALAEAEARLRRARLAAARPSELFSSIELRKAELDLELAKLEVATLKRRIDASRRAREAGIEALQSEVRHHQNRVEELQDAMRRMTRTAPQDGLVIYVTDWREQKKQVGDSCWYGERVVEIPDLLQMAADGEIEEARSGQLREGLPVALRLDAHPDRLITGRVTRVVRAVQEKSWRNPVKVVRVEILLDDSDPEVMRPGMRFRGTVETRRIEQAVQVPAAAVFTASHGAVAFRIGPFGVKEVALELGARGSDQIQVLSGLEAGDRVALERPE